MPLKARCCPRVSTALATVLRTHLEKVGCATGVGRIRAGAGVDPEADGGGGCAGDGLCGDAEAVGEGGRPGDGVGGDGDGVHGGEVPRERLFFRASATNKSGGIWGGGTDRLENAGHGGAGDGAGEDAGGHAGGGG